MAAEKMRKDQLQPIWFAAGTAALMACIERAVVMSLFNHWRVWAFLALNLLLLAILFTSKSQIPSNEINREDNGSTDLDRKKMSKKHGGKSQISSNEINREDDDSTELDRKKIGQKHGGDTKSETKKTKAMEEHDRLDSVNQGNESVKFEFRNEDDEGKLEIHDEISKEELNQRVEAFIAMFRQHLVYDAKGKSFGEVNSTRRASFS